MCIDIARPYFVVVGLPHVSGRAKGLPQRRGGVYQDAVRSVSECSAYAILAVKSSPLGNCFTHRTFLGDYKARCGGPRYEYATMMGAQSSEPRTVLETLQEDGNGAGR